MILFTPLLCLWYSSGKMIFFYWGRLIRPTFFVYKQAADLLICSLLAGCPLTWLQPPAVGRGGMALHRPHLPPVFHCDASAASFAPQNGGRLWQPSCGAKDGAETSSIRL